MHRALVLAAMILTGCGGGSSTAPASPLMPQGKLFGYYNVNDDFTVADHVNIVMEFGWPTGTTAEVVRHMMQAKVAGIPHVMLAIYPDEAAMRGLFDAVRTAGLLELVHFLYVGDEWDVAGLSDAQALAICALTRRVASDYPELAGVRLASFYGPTGKTPGLAGLDVAGRDRYGAGPQDLPLGPTQQLMVIAGGATEVGREDPRPYVDFLRARTDAIMLIAFLCHWPDRAPGTGICENGMLPAYRMAGNAVIH